MERAEHGIIYIDEIDKITRKGENVSITRDVSGEGEKPSPEGARLTLESTQTSLNLPEAPA